MKNIVFIFFLFLISIVANSQLLEDEQEVFSKEIVWGINKNTSGGFIGGFTWSYNRYISEKVLVVYGIEVINIKHESERRYRGIQGQTFVYGKSNYLYAIRFQYGRKKILVTKDRKQGVQISILTAGGPSFGLQNPYYVRTISDKIEKYNYKFHTFPQFILGPGRLLQGLGESRVVVGLNLKGSILFELGRKERSISGLEIGFLADIYTKKIELIPTLKNPNSFATVFVTLYWGIRK